jgi:hypothetical protein
VPVREARPEHVELIRNVLGVHVGVSSQVKNSRIVPEHLIDRDTNTAWNSRTNRMAGAWLEVRAPGSSIHELRLTVGHTGTGPKGEDYFTMNPRIVKIAIDSADGRHLVTLDPESRQLQTIAIEPAESVRLTIIELRPGTKASWREAVVSELEAWGTPPATWRQGPDRSPRVVVGGDRGDFCAVYDAEMAERRARIDREAEDAVCGCKEAVPCPREPSWVPGCDDHPLPVRGVVAPWRLPTLTCEMFDSGVGPTTCWVALETSKAILLALPPIETTYPILPDAYVKDIVEGGAPELVIRASEGREQETDAVVICLWEPLLCTAPEPASTAFSHPPIFR